MELIWHLRVVSAEKKVMIGALRCMYLLTKWEISHTTNFTPLCELGKALGAQYLQDMKRQVYVWTYQTGAVSSWFRL